jgi:hypothetical protein
MSQTDAAILLGLFSGVGLTIAHAWMKSNVLPDWVKFIVAALLSLITGFLTAYISGQVVLTRSVIENASYIGAAGAAFYIAAGFTGLERVLFPRASVITEAQKSVAGQIGTMSTQTIKDAVDPNSSTVISVSATPVSYMGPESNSVQPQG